MSTVSDVGGIKTLLHGHCERKGGEEGEEGGEEGEERKRRLQKGDKWRRMSKRKGERKDTGTDKGILNKMKRETKGISSYGKGKQGAKKEGRRGKGRGRGRKREV